jgi:two-component system, OmpR family, heavy metal sensor histidine kinase CusS
MLARWSITARLTLFYTLSAFGMMAAVTAFQYWILIRGMERDDIYIVVDRVHMLETTLRFHGDNPSFLDHEVNLEGGLYKPGQHYVFYCRVLDEAGRVMIETPDMTSLVPVAAFPAPVTVRETPDVEAVWHWQAPNGRSYFLMSAWARSGGNDGPRRVVQVAMDDIGERVLIADYRRDSLLALAAGTLLFAGAGYLIARRGMRPVRAIARSAERITASRLHERIERRMDPAGWPKELTALAQAFDHMLIRLEESFTRMSQCAEDLAHELRTPIHNLMGEAEVALSRERKPEEYRQVLESSLEEYGRLARMINELLFLARAENPHTQIERMRLDARRELEAAREFHAAVAEEQGVSVTCQGHGCIDADPILFRRAVSNILSNALRYTSKGDEITLTVDGSDDSGVVVKIADTGCGIAAEHLPRIFDRFYRPDRANLRYAEGAGLGLTIVKSVMELHGGSAVIESTIGTGTTVSLRFPAPARTAG